MSRRPHNVPPKRKNRPTKVALREMATERDELAEKIAEAINGRAK